MYTFTVKKRSQYLQCCYAIIWVRPRTNFNAIYRIIIHASLTTAERLLDRFANRLNSNAASCLDTACHMTSRDQIYDSGSSKLSTRLL
jgi:hypothetical protein